jgi:hypothetical protein
MSKPRIVIPDLRFQNVFGELGPEHWVTGHWTAGPVDDSLEEALTLCRAYHADHRAKGWGGIGYHFCFPRTQYAIICLRPTILKGAHVGSWNTGNVGAMFHGGYPPGSKPTMTTKQGEAFHWWLLNAHTRAMPAAHRTDRKMNKPSSGRRGHNDWPGHESNQCPGSYKREIIHGGNL